MTSRELNFHKFASFFRFNLVSLILTVSVFVLILLVFNTRPVRNLYTNQLTSALDEISAKNYSPPSAGWAEIDHLTDCIALSLYVPELNETENLYLHLMQSPAIYSSGGTATGCPQLIQYLKNPTEHSEFASTYSRYWHGYIVVLWPLVILGGVTFAEVVIGILVLLTGALLFRQLEIRAPGSGLVLFTPFLISPNMNLLQTFSHSLPLVFTFSFSLASLKGEQRNFQFFASYGVAFGALLGFFSWLSYPALYVGLPIAVMSVADRSRGLWLAAKTFVVTTLIFAGWITTWGLKIFLSRSYGPISDNVSTQFDSWTQQPDYMAVVPFLYSLMSSHLEGRWYWTALPLVALIGFSDKDARLYRALPGFAVSALISLAYWVALNGHTAHSFSYTNLWGLTAFTTLSTVVVIRRGLSIVRISLTRQSV